MKRPRRYFDRRWLDGWCATVEELPHASRWSIARLIRKAILQPQPFTAYECGVVDAALDSVGC